MSTSPNEIQTLLQLYKGSQNAGSTQGTQSLLAGLGNGAKLVGSSSIAPDYSSQLSSAGTAAGGAANGLGIYNGIQQGGVTGYGGAAVNAAGLAQKSGVLPSSTSPAIGSTANDLSSALGIYSGIKQGGVAGDSSAAINAAKLGSNLGAFGGASSAVGAAAGYAAVPLSLYNEINNWQSGATGADALSGAETGAAIGSIVPGIGTVIGGLVGGAAGALSSAFGNGKVDPENQNFNQYTQAYNSAAKSDPSQAAQLAASTTNPYLPLAGYFDLRSNQLKGSNPIYQEYGRQGEQAFTNDLISQVQTDQKNHPGETASQIYTNNVQPWINSMGNWQDSNKDAMEGLIQNMTSQIANGTYTTNFKSVGGADPFVKTTGKAGGGLIRKYAHGGMIQRYDDGGDVTLPEITVTADQSPNYDGSDYSGPSLQNIGVDPGNLIQDPSTYDVDNISELPSVQNSISPSLLSQLSNLSGSQLAALGLSGLVGGLAGANAAPNMTANYNPSPPQMFTNSGPVAPGQSQYSNVSTTPRTQTHPNINYATAAQSGGVPQFFTPSTTKAPSPLATGIPAAAASPVASQTSPVASGTASASTVPVPIQNALLINSLSGGAKKAYGGAIHPHVNAMAHGGLLAAHGDGVSPIAVGATLPHGTQVKGPGDGTSDNIPAVLSDGEYVIPAHIVSALGNGSNDAGAKALDNMQNNVRVHVGKQMAKGKHPGRIGSPEKYLK